MNVAGPCLVFDSLSTLQLPIQEFLTMVGAAIAMLIGVALLGLLLLKVLGLSVLSYLPSLVIGNTGNLGLPLCLFAFGEKGLGLAVAVYVTNSVGQFTLVPLLQSRSSIVRAAGCSFARTSTRERSVRYRGPMANGSSTPRATMHARR